ncbi:hypothetical protein K458DRAFT_453174 [Lentithecium fluviatile CBS 122367]|uniref:Uncharacterized protein n=1 Tax=Lentithecium fluviatile CBS 122367 TaxID=1168545 RepID=A0A6G1IY53_9PLEO|nr:hypothetical protein K458DRAFT_453174 [Lentithecium fluviatile CBS 122367]
MDAEDIRRCVIALLLPLFLRATNVWELCVSSALIVATVYLAEKCFDRPFNRDLALLIFMVAVITLLSTYAADFVLVGEWPRLLITYIFHRPSIFYVSGIYHPEEVWLDRLGQDLTGGMGVTDLPSTSLRTQLDPEAWTPVIYFDATRPAYFVVPLLASVTLTAALWQSYNAEHVKKLIMCIAIVFWFSINHFHTLAALARHMSIQRHRRLEEAERQRLADEAKAEQRRIAAALEAESQRLEIEKERLAQSAAERARLAAEEKRKLKAWQAENNIPDVKVIDCEGGAGACEPASPELKPAGVQGLGRCTKPQYNPSNLLPLDGKMKTRAVRRAEKKAAGSNGEKKVLGPVEKEKRAKKIAGLGLLVGERKRVSDVVVVRNTPTDGLTCPLERQPAVRDSSPLGSLEAISSSGVSTTGERPGGAGVAEHSLTSHPTPNLPARSPSRANTIPDPDKHPNEPSATPRFPIRSQEQLEVDRNWWNDVCQGKVTLLGKLNDVDTLKKMVESLGMKSVGQSRPSTRRRG